MGKKASNSHPHDDPGGIFRPSIYMMGSDRGDYAHDLSGGSGELDPIEVSGDPWRGFLTHLKPHMCQYVTHHTQAERPSGRTEITYSRSCRTRTILSPKTFLQNMHVRST